MKNLKLGSMGMAVVMVISLCFSGGIAFADNNRPLTPELAAKKENFRKQDEQRITQDKRKAAAEALKAERLKVYNAKRAVKQSTPATLEIK
ncbi:MAG: hypothetical protein HGB32_02655 [Geobacteraceae bacterium]|nr:hypothetical protein [Geobacteraceae bacterium]NTW79034.1 hypothetical protein [Geobacteraceae bacterium]